MTKLDCPMCGVSLRQLRLPDECPNCGWYQSLTVAELLAEYARILNDCGQDEAASFVAAHRENEEFVGLATVASKLKRALTDAD